MKHYSHTVILDDFEFDIIVDNFNDFDITEEELDFAIENDNLDIYGNNKMDNIYVDIDCILKFKNFKKSEPYNYPEFHFDIKEVK